MYQLRKSFLLFVLVMLMVSVVYADPSVNSLNVRFTHWQEDEAVIHIFVFNDHGRPGQANAVVAEDERIIMGYEWSGASISEIFDFLNDETSDLTLSIDGGAPFSVKDVHQEPFVAATGSGRRWTWDHDGDGSGDGDGDGIGDWNAPVSFFRYSVSGLSVGTHTFEFTLTYTDTTGNKIDQDLITVEVVAP